MDFKRLAQIICLKIKEIEGSLNQRLDGLESRIAALEQSTTEQLDNANALKDGRLKVKRSKTKKKANAKKSRWRQSEINTHPSNGRGYLIGNEKRLTKNERKRQLMDAVTDQPATKKRRLKKLTNEQSIQP